MESSKVQIVWVLPKESSIFGTLVGRKTSPAFEQNAEVIWESREELVGPTVKDSGIVFKRRRLVLMEKNESAEEMAGSNSQITSLVKIITSTFCGHWHSLSNGRKFLIFIWLIGLIMLCPCLKINSCSFFMR